MRVAELRADWNKNLSRSDAQGGAATAVDEDSNAIQPVSNYSCSSYREVGLTDARLDCRLHLLVWLMMILLLL